MIEDYLSIFPRNFEAKVLDEIPTNTLRTVYFPGASEIGGKDGLLVSVSPNHGSEWLGIFAFGAGPAAALSSTPEANKLLVISRGAGYFVSSENPSVWTGVSDIFPITTIRPVPEHGVIVLADFTSMAAFGGAGLRWKTDRISFDGLSITHIGEGFIDGEAWDPTARVQPKFRVNIETGACEGGASPQKYRLNR